MAIQISEKIDLSTNKEEIKQKDTDNFSENQWLLIFKRLRKNRVAMIAVYFIILNMLIAFFYPILMAAGPIENGPGKDRKFGGGVNAFPNLKYPAGTDQRGLDSFSRLLAGAEVSMLIGIVATVISIFIGVMIGLLAGYYQGKTEEVLMRITDLFLAVPFLILALILIQMINFGNAGILNKLSGTQTIILILGIFGWAGLARLVTASVKQVMTLEYIDAVRIMGASDRRIIFIHVLPNVLAPIIVLGAIFIAGNILSEAGLAFLGFGDVINTISWGIQVSAAQLTLDEHPEQALVPGMAIFFLVLSINLFGDALRDALDPRLKE